MDEKEQGQRVAGRIVYEIEAVGVVALILAVVAAVEMDSELEWFAIAAFLFVSALAFGALANAVLRR